MIAVGGVVTDGTYDELTWCSPCEGQACIEFAATDDAVMMRSSANPDVAVTLNRNEWRAFLAGAKDGLLDAL